MKSKFFIYATIASLAATPSYAAISFNLTYIETPANNNLGVGASQGGINNSGITADLTPIFERAITTFETHLTGYRRGITGPAVINLTASAPAIDGAGGTLAFAGTDNTIVSNGTTLATNGSFYMDIDDLVGADPDFAYETVFHEMSHALGIGTLWEDNGLYVDGTGQYTGEKALEKYQRDFDQNATFVPVELDGGPGTANAHWDEGTGASVNNPDAPYNGNPLDNEILSGTAATAGEFLSDLTLGSFYDLGYTVDYIIPDFDYYWDAGNPTQDGAITSADGIWRQGTTNFTNENGEINRVYEDTHNMFFTENASIVTLEGTLAPDRLVFAVDGYTFTGGELNTDNNLRLTVLNAGDTFNLDTAINGTGLLTIDGSGIVNNTAQIRSNTTVTSGNLINNGTGTISGILTIGENATLRTDANGLSSTTALLNNGNTNISADQIIRSYTSNGGVLDGAGKLTADTYNLNDNSIVNTRIGTGVLNANGTVQLNADTETSTANIQSGVTTSNGLLRGNINISDGAELRAMPNSLDDNAAVANSGTLTMSGDETIGDYTGTSTGLVRGNGKLTTNAFSGGGIEVTALNRNTLNLTVESRTNSVTLGEGSSIKLDLNGVNVQPFDSFTLFENTTGVIGDDTSIGFESLELTGIASTGKAVFETSTGRIHIVGDGVLGNTANTSATVDGLYGITSRARFSNVVNIARDSQAILQRVDLLANASLTDNITRQTQLEELSPEIYGSIADYTVRQHLSYKDAATYAQYTVRNGSWQVFAGLNNQNIKTKSSIDNANYEMQGTGGYIGVSNQASRAVRFGLYAATDDGDIMSNNGLTNLDAEGKMFGVFTEINVLMPWEDNEKFGLITAGVSLGRFDYSGTRNAQLLTNTTGDIRANSLAFGLGYKVPLIDNKYLTISPYLGFDYIQAEVKGFSEAGALNNLTINDYTKSQLLFNYGLEAQWRPTGGALGFTAKIGLQENLGDDGTDISANFAGAADFTVNSPGLSNRILEARGGIFLNLTENAQIRASYFQLSGKDIDSATGGNIGFSLSW